MNEGSSEYPAYKVPTGWAQGTYKVGVGREELRRKIGITNAI